MKNSKIVKISPNFARFRQTLQASVHFCLQLPTTMCELRLSSFIIRSKFISVRLSWLISSTFVKLFFYYCIHFRPYFYKFGKSPQQYISGIPHMSDNDRNEKLYNLHLRAIAQKFAQFCLLSL